MIKNFYEFIFEQESETKELTLGQTHAGTKVKATMKLGNTIELESDDFKKLINMRVSHKEEDMFNHIRGAKEYKISKNKHHKYTIFHNNQTLHKLEPVGVFIIPKKNA